jgi:hypothetical protein
MKSSLIIVLGSLCSFMFAQSGNTNLSSWHNSDKVDMSDYQSVRNSGLYFHISNDNDNVYIDLKFDKHEDQNMILNEGLILWINMDGKPVKILGVRYPAGSQKQSGRSNTSHFENNANQNDSPITLLSMANTIELIGFISETERRFPSQNADNFRGSVTYENGILFYKMLMPVAKLPVRNSKEGKGAMPFTMGIEYGFPPDINKTDDKMGTRRNARVMQTVTGSEMHWIKNVRLATSK